MLQNAFLLLFPVLEYWYIGAESFSPLSLPAFMRIIQHDLNDDNFRQQQQYAFRGKIHLHETMGSNYNVIVDFSNGRRVYGGQDGVASGDWNEQALRRLRRCPSTTSQLTTGS